MPTLNANAATTLLVNFMMFIFLYASCLTYISVVRARLETYLHTEGEGAQLRRFERGCPAHWHFRVYI